MIELSNPKRFREPRIRYAIGAPGTEVLETLRLMGDVRGLNDLYLKALKIGACEIIARQGGQDSGIVEGVSTAGLQSQSALADMSQVPALPFQALTLVEAPPTSTAPPEDHSSAIAVSNMFGQFGGDPQRS